MARDEELARERIANPSLPSVLRLYSWRPPAVSIGYQQKLETIDVESCNNFGIDVVRRPTGGRAVLHINELTYAIITYASPAEGLYAVHNQIISALVNSLVSLAAFDSEPLTVTPRSGKQVALPVACFASAARHEVTWNGKKVIGSAQRRFGEVVLQHGSILLSKDHLLLPELLALSAEEKIRMRQTLEKETATLSDVFGHVITIQECAAAIKQNFRMPEATLTEQQTAFSLS